MSILIIDNDDEKNLQSLAGLFPPHSYPVVTATDAPGALSHLEKSDVSMVFLATALTGAEIARLERTIKLERNIPLVLVSSSPTKEDLGRNAARGADDVLFPPFIKDELLMKVRTFTRLQECRTAADRALNSRADHLKNILRESVELNREMVFRLLAAAEYKDDETGKHIIRVGKYCRIIAEELGFKGEFVDLIESAAPMHDLGKIGIPDRMLFKSGKLSPKEFEIMKSHTVIGASILEGSNFPLLTMACDIALSHHEKWDSSGYPHARKGDKIPLTGRIAALADVFDALTSPRPYKPAFSLDKSLIIIKENRGRHFDPAIVDAFIRKFLEIETVYRDYRDPEMAKGTAEMLDIERMR